VRSAIENKVGIDKRKEIAATRDERRYWAQRLDASALHLIKSL